MKYTVDVPVRWSDMDAYGHVNHARTVTLIEDARTRLVFEELPRRGLRSFLDGLVVSRVVVDYLAPIVYRDSPIRVVMWVESIMAASFVLKYEVRPATGAERLLARAETTMVAYDVPRARLRRLTADERLALAHWGPDGGTAEPEVAEPEVAEPATVESEVAEPGVVEPATVESEVAGPAGGRVVEPAGGVA